MKNLLKVLLMSLITNASFAQSSIVTPTGVPLTIGNNGVKMANLTSASTPAASNNLALSVDATGNIILVPASAGSSNPTFRVLNTSNTMGGTNSGNIQTLGAFNTFLGSNAGQLANGTTAAQNNQNTYIGSAAGYNTTVGNDNTFIGVASGANNQTGISNVSIGSNAGFNGDFGVQKNFSYGTFIGNFAGKNTNANENSFIGFNSGSSNSTGYNNTFIGANAGVRNVTGINSVMIGRSAGWDGSSTATQNAEYSTFLGTNTGARTNANFNTFIGYNSGFYNTTGVGNTFIGTYSGAFPGQLNNSSCTFIGQFAGPWSGANPSSATVVSNITNANAIGNYAQCIVSNGMVLGGVGANAVNVGIGLNNPAYPLDVKGVVNMRLSMNSPGIKINEKDFMGIDEDEKFWVSNFKIKYNNENEWSDKVFEKSYKLLKINELESFIAMNKHLPNIPSASEVVKKGIDNAEITSKLLEKIEEQALYIIELNKKLSALSEKVIVLENSSKK